MTIKEAFHDIKDPRVDRGKLHKLSDILAIAICAVIAGADGWDDIERFAQAKQAWFSERLELEHGVPSSDTFRRVIALIRPRDFAQCFLAWTQSLVSKRLGEVVPLDGKTLRGSSEQGVSALHMVSAWASANELLLAQEKVDDKSNEITAIPRLLEMLDLAGCIVTIDAMGCQKEIAQKIVEQGADYLLALKANQGMLYEEVQSYFEDGKACHFKGMDLSFDETEDLDHGRREVRRCSMSSDVQWLRDYDKWAGLRSIVMVEYERETYTKKMTRLCPLLS